MTNINLNRQTFLNLRVSISRFSMDLNLASTTLNTNQVPVLENSNCTFWFKLLFLKNYIFQKVSNERKPGRLTTPGSFTQTTGPHRTNRQKKKKKTSCLLIERHCGKFSYFHKNISIKICLLLYLFEIYIFFKSLCY